MSEIMMTLGFVLISLLPGIMSFPQEIGVRIPNLCLTNSGSLCRFPFIFKGKRYTECTYTESPTPWCATRVDTDDTVITNQWEDCDPFSCPIYLRQAMFIQTFFSIQTWRNETMVIQTSKKYL